MKIAVFFMLVLAVFILAASPAAAEGISVSAENGDKVGLFEDVSVDREMTGNVIAVLGNVKVDSKVNGIVVTVFGDADVNAEVTGQVVTVFGNSILGEHAVTGNLITLGSVEKKDGARVLGQEVRIFGELMNIDIGAILYLRVAVVIIFAAAVLIIGLLVLLIYRKKYEDMTQNIENRLDRKIILGFLAYLGTTILMAMMVITLIAPALYLIILIMSSITSSIFFGRLILKALNPSKNILMEFVTGLVTVTLVKLLLIYIVPQEDIILDFVLLGAFSVFINSIGLGIILEARAEKK